MKRKTAPSIAPVKKKTASRLETTLRRLGRMPGAQKLCSPEQRRVYVERVFRLACTLAKAAQASSLAAHLMCNDPAKPSPEGFIDPNLARSSKVTKKPRSKHAAALKYAAVKGWSPDDFMEKFQHCGGYNGCAHRLAVYRRKKAAS